MAAVVGIVNAGMTLLSKEVICTMRDFVQLPHFSQLFTVYHRDTSG